MYNDTVYHLDMNQTSYVVPASLYLSNLQSLLGIPYIWAGKDPHGLDCSGAVAFAYKQSGGEDISNYWNCAKLIGECVKSDPADYFPGMLAFYGPSYRPSQPTHVMTVTRSPDDHLIVTGATGGNSDTITVEIANKIGACVKTRPSIGYRRDLLFVGKWNRLDYTK